ncbi:MAG: glycosyltransferase [Thermodesulfobacteriota bacterium]|nr:glycosyltransferase [Thermodesulfobacteriota bacterium]
MKVAFIVDMFPSLAETFILNQITGLIDLGHNVEIFAGARSTETEMHPEIQHYGLLKRTHYHNEVPQNRVRRLIKGLLLIVALFPRYPTVVLRSLNVLEYGGDAWSLSLFYKVALFLRHGTFDIIQCHFGHNGNLGALLKKMGIHGKIVTMFHGYDLRRASDKDATMYAPVFQGGDCLLAISDYSHRHLVALGADPDKITYHPVGIDVESFPFRWASPLKVIPTPTTILSVARLRQEKGLSYGIRAVNKLLRNNPHLAIEYRVIGGGPLKEELERLVHELKLHKVVRLLGPGNRDEVIKALAQAHLFLLPSDSEVLPVVLMEASATGLPAVATSVGAVREIVMNGKSGFLVPRGDVEAMAERLEHLIKYPALWTDMGQVGRKVVEEKFYIRRLNKRLVEIYEGLLA